MLETEVVGEQTEKQIEREAWCGVGKDHKKERTGKLKKVKDQVETGV